MIYLWFTYVLLMIYLCFTYDLLMIFWFTYNLLRLLRTWIHLAITYDVLMLLMIHFSLLMIYLWSTYPTSFCLFSIPSAAE